MWGPLVYPKVDDVIGVTNIAEATYRFVHGEILAPNRYHKLLDEIMDKCDETITARGASHDEKMYSYKQIANQRFYGKTAIETFIAIELAMTLATEYNPGVSFRKYLHRAFYGLLALHQSVGPWIDVSNLLRYHYGGSDTNANIASSCLWFDASFYTKTVSPSGDFGYTVAPPREFVARRLMLPLTDSILFDYIALLFPMIPISPVFDRVWMEYKFSAMQTGIDAVRDMRFKKFLYEKEHINVYTTMTTMMHFGTNKTTLSDTKRMEIVEADAFMIPVVTYCMNHARRLSAFRL